MKTVLLSATFLVLLFVGCSRHTTALKVAEPVVYEELDMYVGSKLENLATSLASWNALKDRRGSTYQYTRKKSSSWGGITSETTIKVQDDFVISRIYYVIDDKNIISLSWREEGFDELNDHSEGAPTKRIDNLYEECKDILIIESDVVLSFDSSGILSRCSYGKSGIMIENLVFFYR